MDYRCPLCLHTISLSFGVSAQTKRHETERICARCSTPLIALKELPVSLPDMIEAASRELKLRKRVYPRWVAEGRLSAHKAEHEIQAMRQILGALHLVHNKYWPESKPAEQQGLGL